MGKEKRSEINDEVRAIFDNYKKNLKKFSIKNEEALKKLERRNSKNICPKCNHKWETKSKLKLVTCSSCGLKIPNPNYKKNIK